MSDLDGKKYGVKLTIISTMDSEDLIEIMQAVNKIGYKITICDNGNFVCEKEGVSQK